MNTKGRGQCKERTREAKAINQDLWTMLDKRKKPKPKHDHFERLMHRTVESFKFFEPMEQRVFGINKYKKSGYVKINLYTGTSVVSFPLNKIVTAKATSQHLLSVFPTSEERD